MTDEIKGYRKLNDREIDSINAIKRWEDEVGDLVTALRKNPSISVDTELSAEAVKNFRVGFMLLMRSIAQPESRLK